MFSAFQAGVESGLQHAKASMLYRAHSRPNRWAGVWRSSACDCQTKSYNDSNTLWVTLGESEVKLDWVRGLILTWIKYMKCLKWYLAHGKHYVVTGWNHKGFKMGPWNFGHIKAGLIILGILSCHGPTGSNGNLNIPGTLPSPQKPLYLWTTAWCMPFVPTTSCI